MRDYFNIVLLGAPGSGKGTQANLLKQRYHLEHVSTGDLYRKEIASGSPIGTMAKRFIDNGHLCPDELTLDLLYHHCTSFKNVRGFLLDGVPRTLEQAKMMEGIGYHHIIPVKLAIYIEVDEKEIVDRLAKRAILLKRTDDTHHVILQRILNYENQTKPLIAHYSAQNKLMKVNGLQSVEEVFLNICEILDRIMSTAG
ncbi:MAG: adenylate kinase [Bacteroidetes bacterium]|nr:adenylate kinase [Bacteroidota bacterium]MCL1969292.1 adenylate kinase [Bacteroidota bacterium]